jgi:hypothetical protein
MSTGPGASAGGGLELLAKVCILIPPLRTLSEFGHVEIAESGDEELLLESQGVELLAGRVNGM